MHSDTRAGSRKWRWLGVVLVTVTGVLAAVSLARNALPFKSLGDIALVELYVLLALKHGLLLGPYSRFMWHHPGPLYFWVQIPVYVMSGYRGAGLYAGAVAINVAAMVTLAWVLSRESRGALALFATLAALCFSWRVVGLLASPWTAHVPVLASLTFIVLAAALASGSLRLLPLLILAGSFIAQTHVAFVPLVGVLGAGSLASGFCLWRRRQSQSPWPIVHASAWLVAALWLLPAVEQFSHTPGNVTRLSQFFVTDHAPAQSFGVSVAYWSDALVAGMLPQRVRLPWGGLVQPTDVAWTVSVAVTLVALLPVVAVAAFRAGRRFDVSFALTAFAASLVGLWSTTRIREDILRHDVFWLIGLGLLNLAIVSAGAVHAIRDRWWPRWSLSGAASARALGSLTCALALIVAASMGFRDFHVLADYEATKKRDIGEIVTADESIRRYIAAEHVAKPLIEISGQWGTAASIFVELERAGIPFAVEDGLQWMYTDTYAPTGREDAVVTIARFTKHRELSARPGNVVVLEGEGLYVDAVKANVKP